MAADSHPEHKTGLQIEASDPEVGALHARSLRLGYDRRTVIENLSVTIPAEKITIITGANACGKSTLLRGLARLLKPAGGAVYLDGRDIATLPTRVVATRLGILPQTPAAPAGMTVADLVARGRYPHQHWYRQWSAADEAAVAAALEATRTTQLAPRPIDELSGGQRQRVWIAMALAQDTPILLLDEPTTFLDIAHQIDVLDLLTDLGHTAHRTIVLVLHDLNHACRYADHLITMSAGAIAGQGAPADIVTEVLVKHVFGLDSQIIDDPVTGTPLIVPIGTHHRPH